MRHLADKITPKPTVDHISMMYYRTSFAMWRSMALLSVATLLAACGGGDDGPPVTDISATGALAFSRQATFTIAGNALDASNINLSTTGCRGLKMLPGGTPWQQQVTCTVTGVGTVQVEAKSADGALLLARSFHVPMPEVALQTSLGTLTLEFYPDKALVTVFNFLAYVNAGFYDGSLFHRAVPGFVVQGGGYSSGLVYKKPIYNPIVLESSNGLKNVRGTLGMARGAAADTATSEFYVNLKDNPVLDYASPAAPGYAVFGRVKEGMPVVDAMAALPTGAVSGLLNVPLSEVVLVKATQTK